MSATARTLTKPSLQTETAVRLPPPFRALPPSPQTSHSVRATSSFLRSFSVPGAFEPFIEELSKHGTGAFAGPVSSSTISTVDVGKKADAGYVGGVVAIIAGPGQGQLARVTSTAGNVYTFAPDLAVPLGAGSVAVVAPYVGKVLMMGNVIRSA